MENVKSIRNDDLVKAYEAMHTEPTKERQAAVTRQMVRATFLLPVIPVKGKLPEDFPPKIVKNEKGQTYLPLFTDTEQLTAADPALREALLPIDISDAYAYLVEHKELQGLIINPFAKPNLICPRPMTEALAKLWSQMKTAELNGKDPEQAIRPKPANVRLMVPRSYPDGVTFTLAAGLKEQADIARAWMCMVQRKPDDQPEDRDWMVILQAEQPLKGREAFFQELGKSLAPYIGKRNIIFSENNDNLKGLTQQAEPIYKREDMDV